MKSTRISFVYNCVNIQRIYSNSVNIYSYYNFVSIYLLISFSSLSSCHNHVSCSISSSLFLCIQDTISSPWFFFFFSLSSHKIPLLLYFSSSICFFPFFVSSSSPSFQTTTLNQTQNSLLDPTSFTT